jgi:hypothetical protein
MQSIYTLDAVSHSLRAWQIFYIAKQVSAWLGKQQKAAA